MATPIVILDAQTAAATPPTTWKTVPVDWTNQAVGEFDLEIWAAGSNAVTVAKLVGGSLQPQVLADDNVDGVDTTDDELDITSHAYLTGDGPVQLTTSGTLPGGLALTTDYWIRARGANAISLFKSWNDAMDDVNEINLTSAGSGTHTVVDTADTQRVHWESLGFLGELGDGAVSLTAQMGYRMKGEHVKRALVYALVATFGSAVATSVKLYPRAHTWPKKW